MKMRKCLFLFSILLFLFLLGAVGVPRFSSIALDFFKDTFIDDQVWITDSATGGTPRSIPNTAAGEALTYNTSTNSLGTVAVGGSFILNGSEDATRTGDFYLNTAYGGGNTVEEQIQVVSAAITCTGIRVQVDTAPGAGTSWDIYLRDDGVNTGLTCQIADTATTCNGTHAGVSIVAGSLINTFWDATGGVVSPAGHSFVLTCAMT